MKKVKTSRFAQVYWSKSVNKWESSVNVLKERYTIGYYEKEEEASNMNQIVMKNHMKELESLLINIPERSFKRKLFADYIRGNVDGKKPVRASKYKGVSFSTKKNIWQCNAYINKHNYYVGLYPDEETAYNVLNLIKGTYRHTIENTLKSIESKEERNKWFTQFVKSNIITERREKPMKMLRIDPPLNNNNSLPMQLKNSQEFQNQLHPLLHQNQPGLLSSSIDKSKDVMKNDIAVREAVKLKEELELLKNQNNILMKQIVSLTEKSSPKKRKRKNAG